MVFTTVSLKMHIRRIVFDRKKLWLALASNYLKNIIFYEYVIIRCWKTSENEFKKNRKKWNDKNNWIWKQKQWEAMLLGMCWHIRFSSSDDIYWKRPLFLSLSTKTKGPDPLVFVFERMLWFTELEKFKHLIFFSFDKWTTRFFPHSFQWQFVQFGSTSSTFIQVKSCTFISRAHFILTFPISLILNIVQLNYCDAPFRLINHPCSKK